MGALIGAGMGAYYGEVVCLVVSTALFFTQMLLVFTTRLTRTDPTLAESA